LLYQKALAKFAEQAETFSNMVYEQSDSLQPVAKTFGIETQTSAWMTREDALKFFKNSDKLVNAIFSSESIKEKRNTEAVEAAANTLVSARVLEYKPAAARNLSEINTAIESYLKHEQAMAMAGKKANEILAALKQGKEFSELNWIPPVTINRKDAQGLTDDVMKKVFKIGTEKLPAYDLVEKKNVGYALVKVIGVDSKVASDDAEKKMMATEVDAALTQEYLAAYLTSLKAKSGIKINDKVLNTPVQ